MKDSLKTKQQLIDELSVLKKKIKKLEKLELKFKQSGDALHKSEENYRRLFETMAQGVVYQSADGKIISANPAAEKILGLSLDQMQGRTSLDPDWKSIREDGSELSGQKHPSMVALRKGKPVERFIMGVFNPKKGGHTWIYVSATPVFNPGEKIPFQVYTTFDDITDRKQAELSLQAKNEEYEALNEELRSSVEELQAATEELQVQNEELEQQEVALRESEERYRTVVEKANEGILIAQDSNIAYANAKTGDILAIPVEELMGKDFVDFIHPEDKNFVFERYKERVAGKNILDAYEFRVINRKGETRWLHLSAQKIQWNERPATLNMLADITERKQVEERLKKSQELEKLILASVPHGLFGVEYREIFFTNDAIKNVSGWEPKELIGKSTRILFRNDQEWQEYGAILYSMLKNESVVSFDPPMPLIRKDGREIYCRTSASRIGGNLTAGNRIVAMIEDITERKLSAEALQKSERQMADIIEFLPEATLAINMEGRVIIWNKAIEEMTGILAEEMIGKGDYAYTIPFYGEARPQLMDLVFDDHNEIAAKYPKVTREGDNLIVEVFCHALYSNKGAWVLAKASPLHDQFGNIIGAIESIRDITERKQTEEALRKSEELFRVSMERAPDGVYMNDLEGNFLYGNSKAEEIIGYKREDLIGRNFLDFNLIAESSLGKAAELLQANIDGRSTGPDEIEMVRKDGSNILIEINTNIIQRGGQTNVLAFVRDITSQKQAVEEKRNLQERLNRAEKMEALGTLAGGVAHDLNNVLGIVVGYAELTLDSVDKESPLRHGLVNIFNGGQKAAAIVDDLLTLARRGVPVSSILNLNTIIANSQKSPELDNLLSQHPSVKIKTDLDPDLLNISGSSVHLGKSLYNLISNASEAMTKGGTLTIKTTNQYLDQPISGYDKIHEGDYVVLSVSDTGEGISESDMKRIFEPFYTKKIMGRSGTGLGLAVVWGTVKDHNGYINVHSEEGKGSTFTLYFPVTREEIPTEAATVAISEYMGQGESILIVDDIKEQRDLATDMLSKLNHKVSSVSSGEEAIKYLKDNQPDLIVLDMIMEPGMDGLDTYKSILKINPGQKVIIVSGFSESDRVKEAKRLGAGAYVRKPYIREKLGMAVKIELGRK